MHDFLRAHDRIDLDGAWPNHGAPKDEEAFGAALAQHLWESDKGFSGQKRSPPDQIFFFACHCDTTAEQSDDYTITLHTGQAWSGERSVKLATLVDKLVNLSLAAGSRPGPRPLIFLNACGSAAVDPTGASSFPDLFLKRSLGYIGFIGTDATIPDAFAAQFAQNFYEHLFKSTPVGSALHASRWQLLRKQGNPLGVLYSLYAEPEITVAP